MNLKAIIVDGNSIGKESEITVLDTRTVLENDNLNSSSRWRLRKCAVSGEHFTSGQPGDRLWLAVQSELCDPLNVKESDLTKVRLPAPYSDCLLRGGLMFIYETVDGFSDLTESSFMKLLGSWLPPHSDSNRNRRQMARAARGDSVSWSQEDADDGEGIAAEENELDENHGYDLDDDFEDIEQDQDLEEERMDDVDMDADHNAEEDEEDPVEEPEIYSGQLL